MPGTYVKMPRKPSVPFDEIYFYPPRSLFCVRHLQEGGELYFYPRKKTLCPGSCLARIIFLEGALEQRDPCAGQHEKARQIA